MAIARFKDLCIDAVDVPVAARFWAAALGLRLHHDGWYLVGPTPQHTIWINQVPEHKQAKNRLHLDVYAGSLAELVELGARVVDPDDGSRGWTVLHDPDGQEFCAFLRPQPPALRLAQVVVDAGQPHQLAGWWAELLGAEVRDGGEHVDLRVPGAPFERLSFVPVPEPKAGKNRVHWDVCAEPEQLVAAGATLLRAEGGDIDWDVLADPAGNEFCAFAEA